MEKEGHNLNDRGNRSCISIIRLHLIDRNEAEQSGILGLAIFLSFVLLAAFAPAVAPYDPWIRFEPFQPPTSSHLLGTNDMGNDILSELIYGSSVSLIVGFGAALMAVMIGTTVGLFSGYFRGPTDELLMGITDVFLMIPQVPLMCL